MVLPSEVLNKILLLYENSLTHNKQGIWPGIRLESHLECEVPAWVTQHQHVSIKINLKCSRFLTQPALAEKNAAPYLKQEVDVFINTKLA